MQTKRGKNNRTDFDNRQNRVQSHPFETYQDGHMKYLNDEPIGPKQKLNIMNIQKYK